MITEWRQVPGKPWAFIPAPIPDSALDGVEYKKFNHRGVPITLVRNDYRSWRRLDKIGLRLPHPIANYTWPGRVVPFRHQLVTSAFLVEHERCFCLNDIGTGKTLSAIWAADYLRREGAVGRVLVIAPLSTCMRTWLPEIFQALPHERAQLPRGRKAIDRTLQDDAVSWVVLNPENTDLAVKHADRFGLVIVDEFTKFKNPATKRWKALNDLADGKRLWMMSGTPRPQSPEDVLGPLRLVRLWRLSKTAWRNITMVQVGPFKWVPRAEAENIIISHMKPAIRFKREDCIDLPPRITQKIPVALTEPQTRMLKELENDAVAMLEGGGEVSAANAAAVLSKSLQVMGGGVYVNVDEKGGRETRMVDASSFFEAISDVVAEADCPVLVFAPFRAVAEAIYKHLKSEGYEAGLLIGGTGAKARMACFQGVQDRTLDALVAVPGTMEHGITLTSSHVVVWALPPFSVESYIQAIGRTERPGQKNNVIVYHIIQNSLAERLFQRLNDNQRLQDVVLSAISDGGLT